MFYRTSTIRGDQVEHGHCIVRIGVSARRSHEVYVCVRFSGVVTRQSGVDESLRCVLRSGVFYFHFAGFAIPQFPWSQHTCCKWACRAKGGISCSSVDRRRQIVLLSVPCSCIAGLTVSSLGVSFSVPRLCRAKKVVV